MSRRPALRTALRTRRATRAPLALLALAACGDGPAAPRGALEGTWVLRSVRGAPLPAVAVEGGGMRYTLLADTLRFSAAGTFTRTQHVRQQNASPSPFMPADTTYAHRFAWPYTRQGPALVLGQRVTCGPNELCVGVDEGVVVGDRITLVRHAMYASDMRLVYERVATP
jgi:hypothetical protein